MKNDQFLRKSNTSSLLGRIVFFAMCATMVVVLVIMLKDSKEIGVFVRASIVVLPLLFLYFLPSLIAVLLKNRNALGIFLLNLFLGWTVLGWIASLIWSVYRSENEVRKTL